MKKQSQLKESMSARDIWCLALGAMIGFGCFVLPGNSFLPEAGPLGTALGISIGACMVMIISVSFSYLVRQMPHSGGSFLYAAAIFGKDHGFILGWFLILTYWALVPLNATALGLIGRNLFPGILQKGYLYTIAGFDVYLGEIVIAHIFLIGITIVNLCGGKSAGWTQSAITFSLLGSVALVAIGVIASGLSLNNLKPAFPEGIGAFQAIFAVTAMTPWAFIGFDCIPQAAEEFNFPSRRAMNIMLTAIAIAALLYITVNTATAIVRPWPSILNEDWATGTAVRDVLGNVGLFFVGIAMLSAVLSGMNAFLLSASRLLYAMSNVDAIPAWFGKVNTRTGVPRNALIFLGILSLAAPFLGRQVINWVVDMTSVGASFSFLYACAAATKLAHRKGEKCWIIVGTIGLIVSVFFLCLLLIPGAPGFLSAPSLIALIVWAAVGIGLYIKTRKRYLNSNKLDLLLSDEEQDE